MNLEPRIDLVASALADPTRARILCTLMDGRAYTTKELACAAGVTSQTASFHLQLLADRDFIACRKSGRCSYHRIEDPQVAHHLLDTAQAGDRKATFLQKFGFARLVGVIHHHDHAADTD